MYDFDDVLAIHNAQTTHLDKLGMLLDLFKKQQTLPSAQDLINQMFCYAIFELKLDLQLRIENQDRIY